MHERRLPLVRALATVVLVAAVVLVATPAPTTAAPIAPFTVLFNANDNATIRLAGNNLLTCTTPADQCTNARAGVAPSSSPSFLNNNGYLMSYIDVDSDAATYASSTADLAVPSGSTVLWAGLFWGARTKAGTGGRSTTGRTDQILLKAPGDATYRTVTATRFAGPEPTSDGAYQASADVTAVVAAAGTGTYAGANIAAATGEDRYAGWTIVVVYRNATLPLRNVTVFGGFSGVSQFSSESVTISGFTAPAVGPVNAEIGLVAYEGDRGVTGDSATLNGVLLADAVSPSNNLFNSGNDAFGSNTTARQPADVNSFGLDIKDLTANGVLANGATSATLQMTTTLDGYFAGVVTTAIDLYAPDFPPVTKSVVDLDGHSPAIPGDTLEYTLTYANQGQDPATNVVAVDTIPAGTAYVPGSLRVVTGTGAGPQSDAAGDDRAELAGATNQVRFRLGTGASAAQGGVLASREATSVRFRVVVLPAAAATTVTNRAALSYVAKTLNKAFTFDGNAVSTPVVASADLGLTAAVTPGVVAAGSTVTYALAVTDHGPNDAADVVVTDQLPDDVTLVSATSSQGSCTSDGSSANATLTCALGTVGNATTATVTIVGSVASDAPAGGRSSVAMVSGSVADPRSIDDRAEAGFRVTQAADLAVTATAPGDAAPPGAATNFTIVVRNDGPSDASDLTVSGAVDPAELSTVAATSTDATCSVTGSIVSCTRQNLAVGATVTVTLAGTVLPSFTGTSAGVTAAVSAGTPDPAPANDSAVALAPVGTPVADLRITATQPADAVTAGGRAYLTLTVVNTGPSDARDVAVDAVLPPEFVAADAQPTSGSCTVAVTVTSALGNVPAGGSAIVDVASDVDAATAPGDAVTAAAVTSAADPANTADDTVSLTTTVLASADVQVTLTGPPTITAGSTVDYTVTATNNGPSLARAVHLVDTLPAGFVVTAAQPAAGTCAAQAGATLACDAGDLAPGGVVTVVLRVATPPGLPASLANAVTATSATADPVGDNDTATWTSTTSAAADLQLSSSVAPDPIVAGEDVTYTVTVVNAGPSDAAGVTLTDVLPAPLTVVSAPGCVDADGTVTCGLGALAAGVTRTVTITATVPPDAIRGAQLRNESTATAATFDPSDSNNADATVVTINGLADLSATATAAPATVAAGEAVHLVLTVANAGPTTAAGAQLVDELPAGLELTAVPAGCELGGTTLTCAAGDLGPGAFATVAVDVTTRPDLDAVALSNVLHVSSPVPDPDDAGNSATTPIAVVPRAEISLSGAAPATVVAGDTVRYELTLTNAGPSDAMTVELSSVLPAGLIGPSANPSIGSCAVAAAITCALGTVPAGGSVTLVITATLDPGATGPLAMTATATTPTPLDPASTTAATVEADVTAAADLAVTTSAEVDPVIAGGVVTYTIAVTNRGPSNATGVAVTDTSGGLTFDATVSSPSCAPAGAVVTCLVGALPAGATTLVSVTYVVPAAIAGDTLTNVATVAGAQPDPEPADDTASLTSTIARSADLSIVVASVTPSPVAGTTVDYDLSVSNAGPSQSSGVSIVDELPADVTLVAAVPTAPTGPCGAVGTTFTCRVETLPPGATMSVRLTVRLATSAPPGPLVNTATVASATPDGVAANDVASAETSVGLVADMAATKTITSGPPVAGAPTTYVITALNLGPSDAPVASATDRLPAGFTVTSATASQGTCGITVLLTGDGTSVACELGTLPVGEQAEVTVVVVPSPVTTGDATDTAGSGSGALDPVPANNTATVTAPLGTSADLVVTMAADSSSFTAGATASWTITALNHGPSAAAGVTIVDDLPDGLVVTAATASTAVAASGFSPAAEVPCTIGSGTVTCAVGTLAPDAPVTIRIAGVLPLSATGEVTNRATVTSSTGDPSPGDQTIVVTTAVNAAAVGPPTTEPPATTPATLPPTGSDTGRVVNAGAAALVLGIALLLVTARMRRRGDVAGGG